MLSALFVIIFIFNATSALQYRPTVIMHGVAASVADMSELIQWIQQSFENMYVVAIEIGNGYEDSFLLPMNKQVDLFCQAISTDPHLKYGFNLIGVSQGSLIVRGAVERCSLPAYNLITLVGVHQGTFGIPNLQMLPAQIRELVTKFAYEESVQNSISIAGYWRDPFQLDKYYEKCQFLPEINNEGKYRNETYRSNMLKLNSFVMVYSDIDEIVAPPKSSWFMGYQENSLDIETWNQSRQFQEDLIGMKTLWQQQKLYLFTCHTKHQDVKRQPNKDFFMKNMIPFLNNTIKFI